MRRVHGKVSLARLVIFVLCSAAFVLLYSYGFIFTTVPHYDPVFTPDILNNSQEIHQRNIFENEQLPSINNNQETTNGDPSKRETTITDFPKQKTTKTNYLTGRETEVTTRIPEQQRHKEDSLNASTASVKPYYLILKEEPLPTIKPLKTLNQIIKEIYTIRQAILANETSVIKRPALPLRDVPTSHTTTPRTHQHDNNNIYSNMTTNHRTVTDPQATQQITTESPNIQKIEESAIPGHAVDSGESHAQKSHPCIVKLPLTPCNCTRQIVLQLDACPSQDLEDSDSVGKFISGMTQSTCSDWATLRGQNQLVVSYSLFGKFPSDYYKGASALVQRLPNAYPGWSVRFYHDLDYSDPKQMTWMCSLACVNDHLDFCPAGNLPGGLGDLRQTIGSVWRLAVMGDPLVRRYVVRDADSPVLQREVDAVREWLRSDKCFHMMRDNHAHNQPIMAGTWGGCNTWHPESMPRLRDRVFRWSSHTSDLSRDQVNFGQLLWPTLKKNHLAHDSFWCRKFPDTRPFPTQRSNYTFVGMRTFRGFFANDRIHRQCPVACRPPQHRDWLYC